MRFFDIPSYIADDIAQNISYFPTKQTKAGSQTKLMNVGFERFLSLQFYVQQFRLLQKVELSSVLLDYFFDYVVCFATQFRDTFCSSVPVYISIDVFFSIFWTQKVGY